MQLSQLWVSSGIVGISSAVIGRIADDVALPGKQARFTFLNRTLKGFGGRSSLSGGSKTHQI